MCTTNTSTHSHNGNILNYYGNERKKKREKLSTSFSASSLSQLFWLLSIALSRKYTRETTQRFPTTFGGDFLSHEHRRRHVEIANGESMCSPSAMSIETFPDPFGYGFDKVRTHESRFSRTLVGCFKPQLCIDFSHVFVAPLKVRNVKRPVLLFLLSGSTLMMQGNNGRRNDWQGNLDQQWQRKE